MSAPFLETPRLPGCPSFGYSKRPRYKTEVVESLTGRRDRFRLWEYPLHDYTVTVGPRQEGEISRLLEFYHAMGGQYVGFRAKDYSDFMSCHIDETPTATDQPLVQIAGLEYQITKNYVAGNRTQQRTITKPVAATILVAENGTPTTSGWTLDATTGVITFDSTPSAPVTWGGEFDVPVMFSGDFPVEIINKRAQTVTFGLDELRPDPEEES